MNIKYGKSKKSVKASKSIRKSIHASRDYATLRGMDFSKARDILTKDGFHEHEYGDKDDNNGYAVYRKGDKEVELQYRWNAGKRKNEYHAGKVTNVYVDDDINGACGKKSVKSAKTIKRRPIKAARLTMDFGSYKPWSGAVDTWDALERFDRVDDLERVLDELYYDEKAGEALLSETELNDLLWFEPEQVYEWVGLFYNDETGEVSDEPFEEDIEESRKLKGKRAVKANKKRRAIKSNHKAPRRRSKIMAGPGAGYTIEWELDRIRKVNSFDVTDVSKPDKWGTVTVTADCDVDIDVTIKSAWSYMYGFNHPIEGVSAKIHRVVFDYNISDNYGDLLNFEDYEDLTDDAEYIDEVYNMVYQINEMDAVDILEDDAWEAIKGDEFSYGGGYSHSTWDGTLLEIDDYNFADIQVTDQMVIEYVDAAVTNENLVVEYKIDDYNFRDDYFESEEEAREAAISAIQSGEVDYDLTITKTEWHEVLLNTEGEVDYDDYYDEDVATVYYDDYAPEE